ncbi:MAG: ABC-F family ATP-binding cassette domain-containing protein [Tannerellaceae bacterium]|jgi:ATP-binding cassette subfamily F protein uup|nr:ABC-F family ATP-binding cassette domain-containing protein [Tannerellaceae bacterium]
MISFLQITGLTKRFGSLTLFENITFGIAQGDKIGLIASNGSGKTTLLNIIAGKEDYEQGSVVFRNDLRVGYLEQEPRFAEGISVWEAMNAPAEHELSARQILSKLKVVNIEQKVDELSGGLRKRIALAQTLVADPELIILDEPTNHLDIEMIEWLEAYLARQSISLLIVTHDRYFLDRVCNQIMELDRQYIYMYRGNYAYFLEKRRERCDAQNAETERAANLLRKELEWMRRQPQARATKAKARIDSFYELETKAQRNEDRTAIRIESSAAYIGNKIFSAQQISKRFNDTVITDRFDYTFARYEKLGIVGNNGTGKSTFIKMLLGEVMPDSGHFDVGETIRFGYYSQDGIAFDEQIKVIDLIRNIAEYVNLNGASISASQFLNHFLFPPERQYDYVFRLSGGEKRRLYLCTVLMRNPNFLVLDEPTNDLDIVTLNILEDYLAAFRGCLIVVSHDRYFTDKVVDHILVFHGQGIIQDFPGNYSQYRQWKKEQEQEQLQSASNRISPKDKAGATAERQPKNIAAKRKLSFKEQYEYKELDAQIPLLEAEKAHLESLLNSGTLSPSDLIAHSQRIAVLIDEIDLKSIRWLELAELL